MFLINPTKMAANGKIFKVTVGLILKFPENELPDFC